MKNWEFYEEEIKKNNFVFGVVNGEIVHCSSSNCYKCSFRSISCGNQRIRFLYEEYEKSIRLTDDEKALCKLFSRGWIARDKDDSLYWYENKPGEKSNQNWMFYNGLCNGLSLRLNKIFPQCKFDFIKWEDEEPWEVKVDD